MLSCISVAFFAECDAVIREQYGLIRSPGYPGKYPRYSRCHYTVYRSSPDICEVKLTVERFEVAKMTFSNCSADYFEIQNGHKRYKLCGELPAGSKSEFLDIYCIYINYALHDGTRADFHHNLRKRIFETLSLNKI